METTISNERMGSERLGFIASIRNVDTAAPEMTAHPSWVFELGEDGTVLYSRFRSLAGEAMLDLQGRNFFEEFTALDDLAAYKRHFRSFVNSRKSAASFVWKRKSASGAKNEARVILTKAYTGHDDRRGVVMMEIKD